MVNNLKIKLYLNFIIKDIWKLLITYLRPLFLLPLNHLSLDRYNEFFIKRLFEKLEFFVLISLFFKIDFIFVFFQITYTFTPFRFYSIYFLKLIYLFRNCICFYNFFFKPYFLMKFS